MILSPWQRHVARREVALAHASDPVKRASEATVGLEFLRPGAGDDLPGLIDLVRDAGADPESFFAIETAALSQARREGALLLFDSPSPTPGANALARARIYESAGRERAVVLLPYWNAKREACAPFSALLARCGITCVQLSLPYHDERMTAGIGFARELACENLGLTVASNRQAVRDARVCIAWLEQQGYRRIGVVGVSIGASIASIVAAIDARVRTAALILMADDFADAVWTGSATRHVRESLERSLSQADVEAAWSVISPATHAERLARRLDRLLVVSGEIDTVFLPELTRRYVERLRRHGLQATWARYGCGHYTLALPFYAARAFLRTLIHLRRHL